MSSKLSRSLTKKQSELDRQEDTIRQIDPSSPAARLNVLSKKASDVLSDQQRLALKIKQEDEIKMKELKNDLSNLKNELTKEVKERQESGQTLQTNIDDTAAKTLDHFNENTKEKMSSLIPSLESLTARFVPVDRDVLEKEFELKQLEDQSLLLIQQLGTFQKALAAEKERRITEEAQLQAHLQTLSSRLATEMAETHAEMTGQIKQLREKLVEIEEKHAEDKRELNAMVDELSESIVARLSEEKKTREKEEGAVTDTVEKVFGGLKDGLMELDK
ncbi:uncharacterized protein MONOS_5818 [Monocercomonoides exilis]|uniref:uncharacterized protein n=1 Tax=Monocercomonoides exilis TaxID=2049356 RepID=UPI00355990B2|nr:hypothetical protein MONOS_5818 [Monocercomonoides exilis]|eukprot:MONOS_5818.1-p1 / transcript=MONOS_5818.1 / gene=MONOS_5818 / organism=Monocercomonoides_exilis_PA203 / gene_product=unspecified product / transcript_product=unspecified product / location=Mono_scaffold00174:72777-73812(-) / protein_length=274 / sequence_SO=supercontig / SO=protein_coding / is_pseudo=false